MSVDVERYELSEPRRYVFELERRDFIRLFGAGLVVAVAARSISISRAVAAAFARTGAMRGVVIDPNVPMSNGVLSVSAMTSVIDAIGTRSSSATV